MKIDKQRIAILGLGYLGNSMINKLINWGVDPLIAILLNSSVGGFKGMAFTCLALCVVAFIACYLTLLFYDWSKTDWLGIEAAKSLKEELQSSWLKRQISKILRFGDFFAVIALSIFTDAFIVVIYMRHGVNKYNGMGKRDWNIFLASIVISSISETIVLYGGIEVIKQLCKALIP